MGLDVFWGWVLAHLVSIAGFGLAFVMLAGLLRDRRPPGSAVAWFLAIALIPYVGIPLYLLVGRRKIRSGLPDSDSPAEAPATNIGAIPSELERAISALDVPPASSGNSIRPVFSGEQAYRRLMELLEGATTSIEISTFILGRDSVGASIVERLAEKARSGVEVRLLLDALGSLRTRGRFVQPLRDAGGQVGSFLPVLPLRRRWAAHLRNHRKLVVVDGRAAIVGGMNLAHEYMGPDPTVARWTDLAAVVQGPVVQQIRRLFAHNWHFATGERIECNATPPGVPGLEPQSDGRVQLVASGPAAHAAVMRDALLAALVSTRRRVWIVTPYFIPDESIAGVLSLLARQGKDVRLVVPARSNHRLADWARSPYLQDLRRSGARVLTYQTGMLHAKLMLVDDGFASVGSANLDMRSLYLNFEASVFVYSRACVQQVADHLEDVWFPRCHPLDEAQQSGFWGGARDDLARLLSPLL